MALSKTPLISAILQFADGLKFRQLFLITAALFLLNLIIPDPIPFFDELILGLLATLALARVLNPGGAAPGTAVSPPAASARSCPRPAPRRSAP